jgi:hypothetical protein
MHPHHHHHHHHHHHQHQQQQQQQAMYAQQQQQANMLLYQYNQLQSMHSTYSNPALASARFMQPSIEQQQVYRSDQLVPQSSPQVPTPAQQQQIQRSSPINMVPIPSPKAWINGTPLQNPEVFLPIIGTVSNSKLDVVPYGSMNNIAGSSIPTTPMAVSFESPKLIRHHHSKRNASTDNDHHRRRLHSGSSCYESDSLELSSNEDDEFEVKRIIYSWRFFTNKLKKK